MGALDFSVQWIENEWMGGT
jgi:hypothetical protein